MFSWPRVGEQRHRAPFGLAAIQYFMGRGEGGCARRCGGERGNGRGPLPTFKPRPPTRIHRSSKQTTLTPTLSALPLEPTLLLLPESCTFPIPPSASQPPGSPPKSDFQKSLLSSANPPNLPTPAPATIDGTPTNPTRTNLPPWPQTITASIPTWPLWTSSQRPSPTHRPGHLGPDDLAACAAGLLLSCTGAPTSSTATIQSTPRHDQKPILPTRRSLFATSKAFFSLRNLRNSLSFLILRPPLFAAPAVCCRAVLRCHALPRFSCKTRPLLRVTDPHKVRTTRNRDNLACHHACPRPPRAPSSSSSWGLQTAARKEPSAASRLSPDARASSLSAPRLPPWLSPSPSTTSSSHSLRVTTVFTHQKR